MRLTKENDVAFSKGTVYLFAIFTIIVTYNVMGMAGFVSAALIWTLAFSVTIWDEEHKLKKTNKKEK